MLWPPKGKSAGGIMVYIIKISLPGGVMVAHQILDLIV